MDGSGGVVVTPGCNLGRLKVLGNAGNNASCVVGEGFTHGSRGIMCVGG